MTETIRNITTPSQSVAGRVRAVIVNYNGPGLTARCVQSLLAQDCTLQLETVVVDNHSSEENWRLLQQELAGYPIILHRCPNNLGYAGGINAGARLQTDHAPEYILALNSDITLPGADAIPQLVAALQVDPRRVACSPLIRDRDCPLPPQATIQVRRVPDFWTLLVVGSCWLRRTGFGRRLRRAHLYEDSLPYSLGTTLDCETINGACFMIARWFLEAIGYLDDRTFLYTEETILGASIRARNATACLCTAVIADHIQGASTGMRGRRRPLRRELQQVHSELLYLRHYTGTNWFGQGLFLLVRSADLLLKTLAGQLVKVFL
jgi:GT2 family glycosyltransferase